MFAFRLHSELMIYSELNVEKEEDGVWDAAVFRFPGVRMQQVLACPAVPIEYKRTALLNTPVLIIRVIMKAV